MLTGAHPGRYSMTVAVVARVSSRKTLETQIIHFTMSSRAVLTALTHSAFSNLIARSFRPGASYRLSVAH